MGRVLAWIPSFLSVALHALFGERGCCRFQPTCSAYASDCVRRHGLFGIPLILRRLFRCHPFGSAGEDPVPMHLFKKEGRRG